MTTPTRQEIINAYEALEELYDWALEWAGTRAHSRYGAIREALPSKPRLTMDEIKWEDEEHHLAEATIDDFGRVAMLRKTKEGDIEFAVPGDPSCGVCAAPPRLLTPTGYRYAITEMQEEK